jgi:hypothetical protein
LTPDEVHANTFHVNTFKPLIERLLPLLEQHLCGLRRRLRPGHRRIEVQLEFPWQLKK